VDLLYALGVAGLVGAGVYAMLKRDLTRVAVGLSLFSIGVNLFVVAAGLSTGDPPVHPVPIDRSTSDPLVQALVLTAIVIGAGTSAVVIGLVYRTFTVYGTIDQSVVSRPKEDA
jgi:multicomponent Na+:H+ antiporter subunit C